LYCVIKHSPLSCLRERGRGRGQATVTISPQLPSPLIPLPQVGEGKTFYDTVQLVVSHGDFDGFEFCILDKKPIPLPTSPLKGEELKVATLPSAPPFSKWEMLL